MPTSFAGTITSSAIVDSLGVIYRLSPTDALAIEYSIDNAVTWQAVSSGYPDGSIFLGKGIRNNTLIVGRYANATSNSICYYKPFYTAGHANQYTFGAQITSLAPAGYYYVGIGGDVIQLSNGHLVTSAATVTRSGDLYILRLYTYNGGSWSTLQVCTQSSGPQFIQRVLGVTANDKVRIMYELGTSPYTTYLKSYTEAGGLSSEQTLTGFGDSQYRIEAIDIEGVERVYYWANALMFSYCDDDGTINGPYTITQPTGLYAGDWYDKPTQIFAVYKATWSGYYGYLQRATIQMPSMTILTDWTQISSYYWTHTINEGGGGDKVVPTDDFCLVQWHVGWWNSVFDQGTIDLICKSYLPPIYIEITTPSIFKLTTQPPGVLWANKLSYVVEDISTNGYTGEYDQRAQICNQIRDPARDDTTYIKSPNNPNHAVYRGRLSAFSNPVGLESALVTLTYRRNAPATTINIKVRIQQNTTTIKEWTFLNAPASWLLVEETLPQEVLDLITDPYNLFWEMECWE